MSPYLLLLLCVGVFSCRPSIDLPPTNPWIEALCPSTQEETFRGVPLRILNNLIQSESSWRPHVENRNPHEHSIGLAQVNMRWFAYFKERYGIQDPKNPWQSLVFAADYLRDLKDACGNWEDAVVAYKVGLSQLGKEPLWVRQLAKAIVSPKE